RSQFTPDTFSNVGKEIRRPVGCCAVNRLLLNETPQARIVEQCVQNARLRCLHAFQDTGRLDAAQDIRIYSERWHLERVVLKEFPRWSLGVRRPERAPHPFLSDVFFL